MLAFSIGEFVPIFGMAIPIIAIVGGITAGIVKIVGQQRLRELAHRERIAALERGIDPAKLPNLPEYRDDDGYSDPSRRAQGLLIGGIITLAVGLGLAVMLYNITSHEGVGEPVWTVSAIPIFVGVALLVSYVLVKPRNGGRRGPDSPTG